MTDKTVQTESLRSAKKRPDFLGAFVPARLRQALSITVADLGNVVAFGPRRQPGGKPAPAVAADAAERPVPRSIAANRRWTWALLVAGSLAIHSVLLVALLREPDLHASIGLEAITVELVLGANKAAGLAPTPSEAETTINSPPVPREDKPEAPLPEIARRDIKPPMPSAARPLQAEISPQPQDRPEIAVDPKPAEQPTRITALPKQQDIDKPETEAKIAPARKRDDGKNARDRAAPASPQSIASNSIGRGRSDADTNYRGLVSAHLARHKQFPADARSRGQQGSATVSFSLDGGGRVTSVQLARGSGVASIDQETQAMVRRASPFPVPPSGRPVSFTVPVQFYLR
jgi:periplasmic protein TonB